MDALSSDYFQGTFKARADEAKVRDHDIKLVKPKFSQAEFDKLKDLYGKQDKPENILAIGPFGSIYRRLIAPGLFQFNQEYKKRTGKNIDLNWILCDIHNAKTQAGTVEENVKRMTKAAKTRKQAEEGRLGFDAKRAVAHYISSKDLIKQLKSRKDGVITVNGQEIKISEALVTSLVDTHLKYAKLLSERLIPTVTEKPLVAPRKKSEVEAIDDVVNDSKKNFATDFFPYCDSMQVLEEHPELVQGLGKLVEVHATCAEPGNLEKGRYWLLDKEKAGGGLFVADTAPHAVAWAEYFLNWFAENVAKSDEKLDLSKSIIDAVDTYRLDDGSLLKTMTPEQLNEIKAKDPKGNLETYANLNASLGIPKKLQNHISENLELRFAAGKGIGGRPGGMVNRRRHNKPSLGLELVFEKGRVELSTGYSTYDPYVIRTPDEGKITGYRIEGGELGYKNMIVDWLLAIKGEFSDRLRRVSSAAKNSMKFLGDVYNKISKKKPNEMKLGDLPVPDEAKVAHGWVHPLIGAIDRNFLIVNNF